MKIINSFNSGILSKKLQFRTDFQKRNNGVLELDGLVSNGLGGVESFDSTKQDLLFNRPSGNSSVYYAEMMIHDVLPLSDGYNIVIMK